jgi:MoaA/NifB/PqqE/SkfB family radical SAM enzyme
MMPTESEGDTMAEPERMLSVHLTDLCNNRCVFCIVDSPSKKRDLVSKERIFSFLEENAGKGYAAVNLHGGESTTRADFFEILAKIQDCGYPMSILQTNARKLSKMEYAQRTAELGTKKIVVSIHGSSVDTHDVITQVPNSLSHAVKGIKNAKELGLHVRTNSVVSRLNYTDFPGIATLLVRLGVDHINFSCLHTAGLAYKNFDQVTARYHESYPYLKEAASIVQAAGITLTLEGFPFCMIEGMEQYVIDWGNQKFKMLFRDDVLEDYEDYMDKNMRTHGAPCLNCAKNKVCGGVYKEYIEMLGWDEIGYGKLGEASGALRS